MKGKRLGSLISPKLSLLNGQFSARCLEVLSGKVQTSANHENNSSSFLNPHSTPSIHLGHFWTHPPVNRSTFYGWETEAQRGLAELSANTETVNSSVGRWSYVSLALRPVFFPLHHTAHVFPAAKLSHVSLKLFYGRVVLFSKYKTAHDKTVLAKIWNQSFPGKSCLKDHRIQTAMTSLLELVTFLLNVWPGDPKSSTLSPVGWHFSQSGSSPFYMFLCRHSKNLSTSRPSRICSNCIWSFHLPCTSNY